MNKTTVNLNSQVILQIRSQLLAWYKKYRRSLPWRAEENEISNPYYVFLSEIMLQQTTVPTVKSYFDKFVHKWPTLNDLANASIDKVLTAWQGLGYYNRAHNMFKTIKIINSLPSFPNTPEALIKLPGIGHYTAASVASIAFKYPILPVDGNVIRVLSRLFAIQTPLPKLKKEIMLCAAYFNNGQEPGDFAQSLMDLGSMVCTPRQPKCASCPLNQYCLAYEKDLTTVLPKKDTKAAKPKKYAYAFITLNDKDEVLLEKRPDTGLLRGMVGFPFSPWVSCHLEGIDLELCAPIKGLKWQLLEKTVKHVFTHFEFYIQIYVTKIQDSEQQASRGGLWINQKDFHNFPFPTLMKKIEKAFLVSPCYPMT